MQFIKRSAIYRKRNAIYNSTDLHNAPNTTIIGSQKYKIQFLPTATNLEFLIVPQSE